MLSGLVRHNRTAYDARMEIEIFEYERDRPNRRFIVRGRVVRGDGTELLVTGVLPDDDVNILNALHNGKTLKATVSEILSVRLVQAARGSE